MSLWGFSSVKNEPEVNMSEDLIRDAIDELERETNGKIKATFSKIEYAKAGDTRPFTEILEISRKIPMPFSLHEEDKGRIIEVDDKELSDKEDINTFHDMEVYKFEIFNDKYRFRIFTLVNSIAFPVKIMLDEGIASELEMKKPSMEIFSNDDMEKSLRQILRTQKVRNVVNQLIVLSDVENNETLLNYLSEYPDSSLREIAGGIKWSRALTQERLTELEAKGKIEFSVDSRKKVKTFRVKESS